MEKSKFLMKWVSGIAMFLMIFIIGTSTATAQSSFVDCATAIVRVEAKVALYKDSHVATFPNRGSGSKSNFYKKVYYTELLNSLTTYAAQNGKFTTSQQAYNNTQSVLGAKGGVNGEGAAYRVASQEALQLLTNL